MRFCGAWYLHFPIVYVNLIQNCDYFYISSKCDKSLDFFLTKEVIYQVNNNLLISFTHYSYGAPMSRLINEQHSENYDCWNDSRHNFNFNSLLQFKSGNLFTFWIIHFQAILDKADNWNKLNGNRLLEKKNVEWKIHMLILLTNIIIRSRCSYYLCQFILWRHIHCSVLLRIVYFTHGCMPFNLKSPSFQIKWLQLHLFSVLCGMATQ